MYQNKLTGPPALIPDIGVPVWVLQNEAAKFAKCDEMVEVTQRFPDGARITGSEYLVCER